MTEVGSAPNPPFPAEDPDVPVTEKIITEIRDALELLNFVVVSGFKAGDGQTLSQDVMTTIKLIAAKARAVGDAAAASGVTIKTSEWVRFELAYHQLAVLVRPVTAETLRDTADVGRTLLLASSPAQSFTRRLWLITLGFAAFVIVGDWGMRRFGPVLDGDVDEFNTLMQLAKILVPFAYGGLGACIYLLRSAHTFIHERCFDLRRKPEYFNRIILGIVGGGAVVLFVDQITTDDGTTIQLSAAALGFLAGYSTDFLFNTIERVINALLPKVGIESVRRATPAARATLDVPAGGVTLKELLDRYEKAQGADKDLYRALIEQLRQRV